MKTLLTGLVLALAAATASANFYIVDNFDSGGEQGLFQTTPGVVETLPSATTYGQLPAPLAWGGDRYWQLSAAITAEGQRAKFGVSQSLTRCVYYNDSDVAGYLLLAYGSLGGTTPGTGPALNMNLTNIQGVRFEVFSVDQSGAIAEIQVQAAGTTYTSPPVAITAVSPYAYDVLFSTFTPGGMDITDVDGISFKFSGPIGLDLELTSVGLTPEPTTLTLLGLGTLALLRRRRRKQS